MHRVRFTPRDDAIRGYTFLMRYSIDNNTDFDYERDGGRNMLSSQYVTGLIIKDDEMYNALVEERALNFIDLDNPENSRPPPPLQPEVIL